MCDIGFRNEPDFFLKENLVYVVNYFMFVMKIDLLYEKVFFGCFVLYADSCD